MLQTILDAVHGLRNERLIKGDNCTMIYADLPQVISSSGAGAAFAILMAAMTEAVGQDKFNYGLSLGGVDGTGKNVGMTIEGIINDLPLARVVQFAKQLLEDQKEGWLQQEDGDYVKFNDSGVALNPLRIYRPLLGSKYREYLQVVYRDRSDESLTHPRVITELEKWDYLKVRYDAPGNTDEALSMAPINYLQQGVKLSPEAREHAANKMGFSFGKGD